MIKCILSADLKDKLSIIAAIAAIVGFAYSMLAEIWGLPGGEEVLRTMKTIAVLCSTSLGVGTVFKVNGRYFEFKEVEPPKEEVVLDAEENKSSQT